MAKEEEKFCVKMRLIHRMNTKKNKSLEVEEKVHPLRVTLLEENAGSSQH